MADPDIAAIKAKLATVSGLSASTVILGDPARLETLGSGPYCWIIGLSEKAKPSPVYGPVRQETDLLISLQLGARTESAMLTLRQNLFSALINWQISPSYSPIQHRQGDFVFGDPAWFLWMDQYWTDYQRTTQGY